MSLLLWLPGTVWTPRSLQPATNTRGLPPFQSGKDSLKHSGRYHGQLQGKGTAPRDYFLIGWSRDLVLTTCQAGGFRPSQPEPEGWHPALSASPDVFLPLCSQILPARPGIPWPPGGPQFQCLPGRVLLTSADISRLPCPPEHMALQRRMALQKPQHD